MKTKNSGFTLIELMIVIAMIGILAGVGYPSLVKFSRQQRLSSGIQNIHSALLFAKSHALKNAQTVSVVFEIGEGGSGTYSVFLDNGPGADSGNGTIETANEVVLRTGSMPRNVFLYSIAFNGGLNGGNTIEFNHLGFPTRNAGGAPVFFEGFVNISTDIEPSVTGYKRVSVTSGGNLRIEKSSDGATFYH